MLRPGMDQLSVLGHEVLSEITFNDHRCPGVVGCTLDARLKTGSTRA